MSSMRISLAALGLVLILAVWVFNKYQEARVRKSVERTFSKTHPDALLGAHGGIARDDAGRAEPSLGTGAHERADPIFAEMPEPVAESPDAPLVLDDTIHAVISLSLEQPVSGERALAALQTFRRAGRQSVLLLGTSDDAWYAIRPKGRYDGLLVAIQLANRSGALNEIEYSEFVASLQHAAEQIPATCEVPDMRDTIARARALDARCAPLDAQIGINLANPEGSWSGAVIAEKAKTLGMVLRLDGRFHMLLADGRSLFILQNGDAAPFRADTLASLQTSRLTLILDVPCAPESEHPYAQMTSAAHELGNALNALLVDDELRTLTPAMLAAIGSQIQAVYAKLETEEIPAGSPRALALFS